MFPLGMVLFPGALLPLHVFEPRYRALVRDCVAGEPEFGVVLIDRGHEVGGDDQRRSIGTMARLLQVGEMPDGRFMVQAVGVRRLRVTAWLPDDPYPLADVEDWRDEGESLASTDRVEELAGTLRRVRALASELGEDSGALDVQLAEDPTLASYQLCALAPLGAEDRYRLLSAPGPAERLDRLDELLADAAVLLQFRLDDGGG